MSVHPEGKTRSAPEAAYLAAIEAALAVRSAAGEIEDLIDRVVHQYETDAEFHAEVYRAVDVAEAHMRDCGVRWRGDERRVALLAAATALQLRDES